MRGRGLLWVGEVWGLEAGVEGLGGGGGPTAAAAGAGCGRTVRVCRSFGNLGGWPKALPKLNQITATGSGVTEQADQPDSNQKAA